MPDWLNIAAAVAGVVSAGLALWGIYYAAFSYFDRRLTRNQTYRRARAQDLRRPRIARLYEDWLDGALRLGPSPDGCPLVFARLRICLTLGLLYGLIFLVVAWAFFGGSVALSDDTVVPRLATNEPGFLRRGHLMLPCYIVLCCPSPKSPLGWPDR